ncbi:hypothetical protein [Komagataeibacter sp. FNDCF1]|uniref:structural cement protein Gp24 n=1 Tax=Komagataeibacter sp. FNDCF1 TaxID=2878681 RepID=UPI001E2910EF|nr:hypothetical protein [Komagataeibacter sp. FNDCF1]MCE2563373.1 hypothetical protein [Komagataeibacter sp. FNDCF1]
MVAYKFRMDTGYAGTLSREPAPGDITPENLDPTADWASYGFGMPYKYTSAGLATPLVGSETASEIMGLLVRSYPGRAVSYTGDSAYPQIGANGTDGARRGYMTVTLHGSATPVKGGAVYVRVANAGTGEVIGGIEAAADGDDTIVLPAGRFEGTAGSDGLVEISFNLQ